MDEDAISTIFRKDIRGGVINGNHYDLGKKYIGKIFHVEITADNRDTYSKGYKGEYTTFRNEEFENHYRVFWEQLSKSLGNKLKNFSFLRISAERDIVSELEESTMSLSSTGSGATNLVHKFINLSNLDSKLVEDNLLSTLNKIIYPDAFFTDIVVQQVKKGESLFWEIFLEEKDKGRVAISNSGSGLKTIILVLINFILMPTVLKQPKNNIVFALEELENNLHPALQRSLFSFIKDWAKDNKSTIFLTTHSNIPINLFGTDESVQILHLQKLNEIFEPKKLIDHLDSYDLLNDLDVRASDILQSNGIIWVEGPSDRIYLNKWIDVFSEGKLKEGHDYQIVFYGGKLLSHLELESTNKADKELINLLLTNRNAAIIIDSDKRYVSQPMNNTKKRIKEEFKENNSMCWITKGKEIENYLPHSSIEKYYKKELKQPLKQYQLFDEYLDLINEEEGKSYLRNKVKFARGISLYIEKEDLLNILDFKKRIELLINHINKWNSKE